MLACSHLIIHFLGIRSPMIYALLLLPFLSYSQDTLFLQEYNRVINLEQQLLFNNNGDLSFTEIRASKFSKNPPDSPNDALWSKIVVKNLTGEEIKGKINITFTDSLYVFQLNEDGKLIKSVQTGDLYPVGKREVKSGMMIFTNLEIQNNKTATLYLRLVSSSNISRQFKDIAIRSINFYPEQIYKQRFTSEKVYQALFYGALFIMLFYNFFIYITLNRRSYLYYLLFLSALIIFLSSNSGYLVEVLIPNAPRIDLYIRFLSPALVVFCYLIFSRQFLSPDSKIINKLINALCIIIGITALLMVFGMWKTGRTVIILTAIVSFVAIFFVAIKEIKKGFTPARYFLAANALFIVGGIIYALTRIAVVVQNPLTQHITQVAIALEVALFSLGLADSINVMRKELSEKVVENANLEKKRSIERRALIEEKNRALTQSYQELDTFIYKTAHYIRGPIARLLGISNVGLHDVKDPQTRSYFERFNRDANSLHKIVKRLSSAHEINVQEVVFAEVNIEQLLKSQMFEYQKHLTSFEVKTNIPTLFIDTDQNLIKTIFKELVDNAIQFVDKSKPVNQLVIVASMSGDKLNLEIADNGIGIKTDHQQYLFKMFSKAADIYDNPGLGLYIVDIAAKKLGGIIQFKEHELGMTSFCLQLPLKKTNVLKNLAQQKQQATV